MLFNSYEFLFVFFPATLLGFALLSRWSARAVAGFLGLASLVFYAWWSVQALPLLLGSIAFNYMAGGALVPRANGARPRWQLGIAVGANLALLGLFKYADFFVANLNAVVTAAGGAPLPLLHLALPIGISFYTFTQIAFLVDCWQGKVQERSAVNYLLFVTYFPHLVAGPVLHHAQMMPQFARESTYRLRADAVALGATIFTLGLAKKMLIADPLGRYADLVFAAAPATPLNGTAAWLGAVAYAMQLYFDFSGYSDMAVGLSLCLNIELPINFRSPYRATNLIEFWRRWHISLSTFLRDYLYVPLGGNRRGPTRRYVNLAATMLLGGLWHGASWTFVLWGGLHGLGLIVNHLWRESRVGQVIGPRMPRVVGWTLTFVFVVIAWVPFRANSMADAWQLLRAMAGAHGWTAKPFSTLSVPLAYAEFYHALLLALLISLASPTTPEVSRRLLDGLARIPLPRLATAVVAIGCVGLLAASVQHFGAYSPFLYFQF